MVQYVVVDPNYLEEEKEERSLEREEMDVRKIVVVVEDVEVATTALRWALNNLIRFGDLITLLHVLPTLTSRSKKKFRLLRLKGFQLALTFKEICNTYPNMKTEIVVREGDQEGGTIASTVREIGASLLVIGLHEHSFIYKLAMGHSNIGNRLNCKIIAIKQPTQLTTTTYTRTISILNGSTNLDLSQIDITGLSIPAIPRPKIPYKICPNPSAIIWRRTRRTRRKGSS